TFCALSVKNAKGMDITMTIDQILEQAVALCRRHDASEAILFGSRAKGTARERSDIDLAVRGVLDFAGLEEEMEQIPTLYTIDLVDLDHCMNTLLKEDIEQYGRKIYEKI
ncbi:MAG: nucleotidyltransferase domain-containing protein, partial [Lachnospiraceae bacterium]|nr:nucleotidyltransferase domain-containing protein [Lachnospiraceae bacterium]